MIGYAAPYSFGAALQFLPFHTDCTFLKQQAPKWKNIFVLPFDAKKYI